MKKEIAQIFKKHPVGKAIVDHYPKKAKLYDGTSKVLPWKVVRLIELWKNTPNLNTESQNAFDAYDGGDVIDIGAFNGWYSWLLAPKAKEGNRLVSCEPDQHAWPDLLYNLSVLNKNFPHLTVVPIPLPVGNGAPVSIVSPGGGRGGHPQFLSDATAENSSPTNTVDALVRELNLRPTFVKIDVEGAEYGVLQGMEHTLKTYHPTVMMEVHPQWQPNGVKVEQLNEILQSHNYNFTNLDVSEFSVRQLWK